MRTHGLASLSADLQRGQYGWCSTNAKTLPRRRPPAPLARPHGVLCARQALPCPAPRNRMYTSDAVPSFSFRFFLSFYYLICRSCVTTDHRLSPSTICQRQSTDGYAPVKHHTFWVSMALHTGAIPIGVHPHSHNATVLLAPADGMPETKRYIQLRKKGEKRKNQPDD